MGAIMYTLAHVDFSNRLGVVVSELPSDEIDRQEQTLDAKQWAALPCDRLLARERARDGFKHGGFQRSLGRQG